MIRLPEPKVRPEVEARGKARADVLRPYRGRYVARKDETVLFDADTPHEVVAWLRDTRYRRSDGVPGARRPDGRHRLPRGVRFAFERLPGTGVDVARAALEVIVAGPDQR